MKTPKQIIPRLLALAVLSGTSAFAGSFTANFSNPDPVGFYFGGGAFIETNRLILTPAINSVTGSITLDDLDSGSAIEAFTANFKLQIGPGSGNAADGASFNFGPDISAGSTYGEEGPGGTALTIAFDVYDSGGGEAPAVELKLFGQVLAHKSYTKAEMVTSKLENVSVQLKRNGTVTVSYKNEVIFDNVFMPAWAPTFGYFNISARTGGENAEMDIDDLNITTVPLGTVVAPTFTAQPQNTTANEGASASFSVKFDGTAPFAIQWLKNNVEIPDATNQSVTISPLSYADNNAKVKVRFSNDNGANVVTSAEATLTVARDTTPPTVVKANSDTTYTQVTVRFSEPVNDTALVASRYTLNQGVTVSSVMRASETTVVLTTSAQPQGREFTLTINGVQDTAATPNTIAANTKVTFRSYVFQAGSVVRKKYFNIDDNTGNNPDNLFNDPRYPNAADHVDLQPMFDYPPNGGSRDLALDPNRNYFDSLEGYFIPPTSGDYVFLTCGADRIWFYLSTDEDPANKHLVARIGGWTNARGWNTGQGGTDMTPARTDTFDATEWPQGNTITLEAGKRYYAYLLHHDPSWCGGDQMGVTYKLVNEEDPAAGTASRLSSSVIGTFLDPTGATVTFSAQPADAQVLEGRTASFSATVTGSSTYGNNVTYQWQTAPSGSSTFTAIAGATTPSYTTPALTKADNGRQYQLLATVPGLTQASRTAIATVVSDTIAPKLVSAGALPSQTGATFDVAVSFDEALDPASAGNKANYSISSGTISAAQYFAGSPATVLTVSGLTVGSSYTVTAVNVADTSGNKMASSSLSFTVSKMKWGVVGGDEPQFGNGVVAVGSNGFDVYSDGGTEWGTYDEATLVFEEVTGNFDKKVRVEFQDSSSQWARAGLIARDVTNFGVDRAAQEGGQAGRYQKVHVNPVLTAMGTGGNNSYEGNRRTITGGATTSAGGGGTPAYPNAWCRLKREGQTFTIFRSDDGLIWTQIGSTTWPDAADSNGALMPDKLYVGVDYSPENGNVDAAFRRMFVAKFRDYGDYTPVVPRPILTLSNTGGNTVITYTGTLQSADTVNGPYTAVQGATSPYTVSKTGAGKFYRSAQ